MQEQQSPSRNSATWFDTFLTLWSADSADIEKGKFELEQLISVVNINERNDHGYTIMHYVLLQSLTPTVVRYNQIKFLLEHKADVNITDSYQRTILAMICSNTSCLHNFATDSTELRLFSSDQHLYWSKKSLKCLHPDHAPISLDTLPTSLSLAHSSCLDLGLDTYFLVRWFDLLVEQYHASVNVSYAGPTSILYQAIRFSQPEFTETYSKVVLDILLQYDVNFEDIPIGGCYNAFQLCIILGGVSQHLLDYILPSVNQGETPRFANAIDTPFSTDNLRFKQMLPIQYACFMNHDVLVRRLINAGVSLSQDNDNTCSLLRTLPLIPLTLYNYGTQRFATRIGNKLPITTMLMENGCDVNSVIDVKGVHVSAIHLTLERAMGSISRLILNDGQSNYNPNLRVGGLTALEYTLDKDYKFFCHKHIFTLVSMGSVIDYNHPRTPRWIVTALSNGVFAALNPSDSDLQCLRTTKSLFSPGGNQNVLEIILNSVGFDDYNVDELRRVMNYVHPSLYTVKSHMNVTPFERCIYFSKLAVDRNSEVNFEKADSRGNIVSCIMDRILQHTTVDLDYYMKELLSTAEYIHYIQYPLITLIRHGANVNKVTDHNGETLLTRIAKESRPLRKLFECALEHGALVRGDCSINEQTLLMSISQNLYGAEMIEVLTKYAHQHMYKITWGEPVVSDDKQKNCTIM